MGVTVTDSVFKNCYDRKQGGMFTLISTLLTDDGSEFFYNSANQGGVFYCNDCDITLLNTIGIHHNDGYDGAAFYSDGRMMLSATTVPIFENKATHDGGVLCVNNDVASTTTD